MRLHAHLHRRRGDGQEVLGEFFFDFLVGLVGDQAHGNFGVGFGRQYRLGPFANVAAPNTVHVQRGTDRRALDGRIARFALDVLNEQISLVFSQIERGFVHCGTLVGRKFLYVVVKVGNGDMAVLVVQRGDHFAQHVNRVSHRAAIDSRVQVAVRADYLHFQVSESAQTNFNRRHVVGDDAGVGDQDRVAGQHIAVGFHEIAEVVGANLLLALDHYFDVTG